MRYKIEANEYKDYIIGFIFYKFLSDKELQFLKTNDFINENISSLMEEDVEAIEFIKENLGYFIPYPHLFSTWINKGSDFEIANIRDALNSFSRHIQNKKVFESIFSTLQTDLSNLGKDAASQTKAASVWWL